MVIGPLPGVGNCILRDVHAAIITVPALWRRAINKDPRPHPKSRMLGSEEIRSDRKPNASAGATHRGYPNSPYLASQMTFLRAVGSIARKLSRKRTPINQSVSTSIEYAGRQAALEKLLREADSGKLPHPVLRSPPNRTVRNDHGGYCDLNA